MYQSESRSRADWEPSLSDRRVSVIPPVSLLLAWSLWQVEPWQEAVRGTVAAAVATLTVVVTALDGVDFAIEPGETVLKVSGLTVRDAAGRARVARDAIDTTELGQMEAERAALEEMALADFAAEAGIVLEGDQAGGVVEGDGGGGETEGSATEDEKAM